MTIRLATTVADEHALFRRHGARARSRTRVARRWTIVGLMSVAACAMDGASDTEPVDYAWPVTIVATYPASSAGYPVTVTLNGNALATIASPWVGAIDNCGVIGQAGFAAHQDQTDILTFRYPTGRTTTVTVSPTSTQIKNSGCMILRVPAP